ncbi:MAG: hypothetical protein ACOYNC_05410 [Bacteroidales bacterium]
MWRLIVSLSLLFLLPDMQLMSQKPAGGNDPDTPLRVEIPAHSVNETYRILSCGNKGLVLFFRSQEAPDDAHTNWYFSCYDTNLQQTWVKSIPLFNDQDYRFQDNGKDTLALLFGHTGKSKGPENSFEIVRIALRTGTMILNTGSVAPGTDIDAFGVCKGRGWLGLNVRNQAGKILNLDLARGITRLFSLGNGNQISVLWMKPDSNATSLSAIVGRQISKKSVEYYLVKYDTAGVIKREVLIGTQSGERTLTQVRVAATAQGAELVMGSYGQGVPVSSQKNKSPDESTGLFATLIKEGAQRGINFYNFLEMKSASAIVGESDIVSLKKKALKKQKTLAEYSLDYSVLMHDVIEDGDHLVLTAEFFSPQYHTESFTDFDFYGRPYTNSYSVFDGYRFYNALVAGFDSDGKLLWDNYIDMRNLVSFELSPKVVTFPSGDDLVLCYVSDGKIGSKFIHEGTVVEKLDFSAIEMLNPDDKLLAETKGGLIHWYSNYFLSYGYQDIKNIALETNNKRLVFYFSKLRFEK